MTRHHTKKEKEEGKRKQGMKGEESLGINEHDL